MRDLLRHIEGDRTLWAVIALLALFSFMPVYSASSNLAYIGMGDGNTMKFLVKHAVHLILGFVIIYAVHKVPYHYFRGLSIIILPVVIILLLFTATQGTVMGGANASRWLRIPFVGVQFQTSTLAAVVLMVYVSRYLAKIRNEEVLFQDSLVPLWLPVFCVLGLILPANFSTTAIIFSMVMMLLFLGGYPFKYLLIICGVGLFGLLFFVLVAKAVGGSLEVKVNTWENRVKNFVSEEENPSDADYQIQNSKIAIATGGTFGKGPGNSVQKHVLPQSSSDFIFAVIIEEFGLLGGVVLVLLYLLLLFRILLASHKAPTVFGSLLVIGVGIPIVFQAFINMGVAVELFPVTGQTLPLVSSGGTSIWMTCLAIGIILSVTRAKEEEVVLPSEDEDIQNMNPLEAIRYE